MNKDLNSFFKQINEEQLFYKIDIMPDGVFHTVWDMLSETDYTHVPPSVNRIIIRIKKTKNQLYFLDFFQQYQNKNVWYGFQLKSCVRYEFQYKNDDDWFDAFFYFNSPELSDENMIHFQNINCEIILLLQQFFKVFT